MYKGEVITHSLDKVFKLKEEDWFSKGVALSAECNRGIVNHSIICMETRRAEGTVKHGIIAAACSIDHARAIRGLYAERKLEAAVIHSDLPDDEQRSILPIWMPGGLMYSSMYKCWEKAPTYRG